MRHVLSIEHGPVSVFCVCFFNDPATTEIYPLSLHDALPISAEAVWLMEGYPGQRWQRAGQHQRRSEEHTSELQPHDNLVSRLLLEKNNNSRQSRVPRLDHYIPELYALMRTLH